MLIKEVKDVIKKISLSMTKFLSSITALAIIIAAPPWNIPQAISLAMETYNSYLDFLAKIKSIVPYLQPIKTLHLLTDKKNLTILSTILDKPIKFLSSLYLSPVSNIPNSVLTMLKVPADQASLLAIITKMIEKLISTLKNLISSKKKSIYKKATNRLIKLGHIPKSNGKRGQNYYGTDDDGNYYSVYAYEEQDVDDILELLKTYKLSGNQQDPNVGDYVSAYVDEDIVQNFTETNFGEETENYADTKTDGSEQVDFVYDVELPNGEIRRNLTQEALDDLKYTYHLIMKQIDTI